MSFTSEVKQEVANEIFEENEARAELSALLKMTSSIVLSSRGKQLLVTVENAAVARTVYRLVKERYPADMEMFVKKKMNLRKNNIYGIRIIGDVDSILEDVGLYGPRGLLDKPYSRIVAADNWAKAYLAGAFLAAGSVNPPSSNNYHLEIATDSEEHARFLVSLLERFAINARITERRSRFVVYVKQQEKIGDTLKLVSAENAFFVFMEAYIERDLHNNMQRLNNIDIANEVKAQTAARKQLEDIAVLEEHDRIRTMDRKLVDIIELRKEHPEASLKEMCELYEQKTGQTVSKSGVKHRLEKIHELAEQVRT